eukprot:scaffold370992_cov28-Prasinocladus_malaysianus.AAC.1
MGSSSGRPLYSYIEHEICRSTKSDLQPIYLKRAYLLAPIYAIATNHYFPRATMSLEHISTRPRA